MHIYISQLPVAFGHYQVPYPRMSDHRITDQRSWNRLPTQGGAQSPIHVLILIDMI